MKNVKALKVCTCLTWEWMGIRIQELSGNSLAIDGNVARPQQWDGQHVFDVSISEKDPSLTANPGQPKRNWLIKPSNLS